MRCIVIIPAYNEEKNIISVLKQLSKTGFDYIVIDDCSNDGTRQLLEEYGASYISLPVNLGIGGAVQTGYKYALEHKYDIAVQIDGDGQHDVVYIDKLIEPIINGKADVVIGSRFVDKRGFQSSGMRRAGINFLSFWIFLMCGKRILDVTSGFRAIDSKFIRKYANSYPDDYPEPEAIIRAVLVKGKVIEIPVVMRERIYGKSSINIKKSIYYMIKVTLAIFIYRISLGFRRK